MHRMHTDKASQEMRRAWTIGAVSSGGPESSPKNRLKVDPAHFILCITVHPGSPFLVVAETRRDDLLQQQRMGTPALDSGGPKASVGMWPPVRVLRQRRKVSNSTSTTPAMNSVIRVESR